MTKDWEYKEIETNTDRYKMIVAVIVAISFGIPAYIYATGSYIEPSQTLDTLVDDGLYSMSAPIRMTNWSESNHYSIRPEVYDNNLLYYIYSGDLNNNISLVDLNTMGEDLLHYDDNYSVRPISSTMWGDYIVSDAEDLPYGVWLQKISTNETILFMVNQTNSDIWDNIVVTARNEVVANILTIYNIDTGTHNNITIGNCSRVYYPKIYEDKIVFCTYASYGGLNHFNLTYYNLNDDTTTVLLSNTAPTSYQFRPFIWGDNIVFARRVNILSYYLWSYNIQTEDFVNLSAISDNKGNVREYLSMWGDMVVYSTFNGSWKLEAYDVSTGGFFSLGFSENVGGLFYPDVYGYENGDYIVAFQNHLSPDTYLIYLNSTAEDELVDVDDDGIIEIEEQAQEQTIYNFDMIYIAIISATIGVATIIFYAIEKRKEQNAN